MSKEAQDFYRSKKVENAKTEKMKRFLSLVNYEEEGKIMQEYVDQQLRLLGVGKSLKLEYTDFEDYVQCHFCKLEGNRYIKKDDETIWTITEISQDFTRQNSPRL